MVRVMEKLKVCVIGAGKMGKYHVREFSNFGCEVCILEANEETAKKASEMLKNEFGISVQVYWDFEELIKNESLDAASICVPPKLHSFYVRKCLENNLHVFCEKPFVLDAPEGNYKIAKELIELAKEKKKKIAVNTQWAISLDKISNEIAEDKGKLSEFSFYMHPIGFIGLHLLTDCLPHSNSILLKLAGIGEIKNVKFPIKTDDEIKIEFDYCFNGKAAKINYHFKNKNEKPSEVGFSINNKRFSREAKIVNEIYVQNLICNNKAFETGDLLSASIKTFVFSLAGKDENSRILSEKEILENVRMQDLIIEKYLSYDNNR